MCATYSLALIFYDYEKKIINEYCTYTKKAFFYSLLFYREFSSQLSFFIADGNREKKGRISIKVAVK